MGARPSLIIQRALIGIITAYQRTLSPDHGWFRQNHPYGYCRYYPTCSEYAVQALRRRGLMRGVVAAACRVIRCNPWASGGLDPIN